MTELTPQLVASLVAMIIARALDISPGLKGLWDKLSSEVKLIVIVLLCFGLPFGAMGLACAGILIGVAVSCPAGATAAQTIFNTLLLGFAAFVMATGNHELYQIKEANRANVYLARTIDALGEEDEYDDDDVEFYPFPGEVGGIAQSDDLTDT